MTGDQVIVPMIRQLGWCRPADLRHPGAAGAEAAAGRWIDRRRQLALEDDALALAFRIGQRERGDERLGIRMQRSLIETVAISDLHDLAEIEDKDAVTDMA